MYATSAGWQVTACDRSGGIANCYKLLRFRPRDAMLASMALQLHINVSLNQPPDRTRRRPPGLHGTSGSTSYETIPPVRLETSGGVLSTVDMVAQRRDGPRWLREHDGDDDDVILARVLAMALRPCLSVCVCHKSMFYQNGLTD